MPLFFRLDTRSQRLVALTDVVQTPRHWLDDPRGAWPLQLPDALRLPIEQRLASGQGHAAELRRSAVVHLALPRPRCLLAHRHTQPRIYRGDPLSEEMQQLVRHCTQLLGHWQPAPPAPEIPLALPAELTFKTGHGYCRALLDWTMASCGARIGDPPTRVAV